MFKNNNSSLICVRALAPTLVGFLLLVISACGGGGSTSSTPSSSNPQSSSVSVAVSPAGASVQAGATQQYQAAVTGSSNTAVAWSVDSVSGGNATVGSISAAGLYTAPGAAGQHTITATSAADQTASGNVTVNVTVIAPPTVSVTVSPAGASIQAGATQQFQAAVTGSSNTAITWTVDGVAGGNATVGSISGLGLYTAPSTAGQHTITATSAASTTASGSVTIIVAAVPPPPVTVTVSPAGASIQPVTTQQFQAAVTGSPNTAVTWSVDGVAGGNATVGIISAAGLYTAPSATGQHTITATSAANATASGNVTISIVTVLSTVSADFGNHLSNTHPISPDVLGVQYSNPMPAAPIDSIYNAGFRMIRTHSLMQSVYGGRSPNWAPLDLNLDTIKNENTGKSTGFKVLMQLTYTPPWLIPTMPGCPAPGTAQSYRVPPAPADVNTWAKLAQSIVAHVDQKYPGLVTDFEIWNEPDLGSFCVSPNDGPTRLSEYLALYAATAPLIRAQAAKDGAVVRIGGPTIASSGGISPFIGGLLNNSSTAPYVDFVSYHLYPAGQSDITGGMQWDQTSPTGIGSLYSRVQSPSVFSGFAAHYLAVANAVKAGKQPNPTQTKIYLDEYNTDWAFSDDCCRNNPTYSPLFNGLVMVDMLDAVYTGAHRVPDSIQYYSASAPPFCLVGNPSHCSATDFSLLYPQYYLYDLFGSPNYLNLSTAGNFMANSVSPLPSTSGLATTAFWSASQDSIVIVNPTGNSYSSVGVSANNPGFVVGHATAFLLNSSNKAITSSALTPANSQSSSTVIVSVPAYSVVAVRLTP